MWHWWRHRQERHWLAEQDVRRLVFRYGVRASQEARCRMLAMKGGTVVDADRPYCHWRRVYRLTRQLLPFDELEGEMTPIGEHAVTLASPDIVGPTLMPVSSNTELASTGAP